MPKKKPRKAIKQALIKNADWAEALRRSPDFRLNCDQAIASYWKNHQDEFAAYIEEHNISDPLRDYHVVRAFLDYSQEAKELAINWQLGEPWHYLYPEPPLFNDIYVTMTIPTNRAEYAIDQIKANLIEGRYLKIVIDLTKPLDLIIASITQKYHQHRPHVVGKRMERGIAFDGDERMWQAYDLKEQGKKLTHIM